MVKKSSLPFDGAITRFLESGAPKEVRAEVEASKGKTILSETYPYSERMDREEYEDALFSLQIELAKFQAWSLKSGARTVILFEGRDAAGKGGTIKRFSENMNPRIAHVVALPKPSDTEGTQWYFQRYIAHLPSAGQIVLFDRSWYNRSVVEKVFDFCTHEQRELFFGQVTGFERALAQEGIRLFKLWLNIGRAEQLRRFLDRERHPLKQWKLSEIDIEGLRRWDAYTAAIQETFERTHTGEAPWTVIRSDDKRRARLAAIRTVLSHVPYEGRDEDVVLHPDPKICGGPYIWDG